ncbi:uncharacterized protein LOC129988074 isoform X2 [Argiope bruennichi]|uniref:uncharacterized protein LOC129988074 isoform X2 n=1 Tax=Argiope bruennichi TaxID=94029 RepID=UPI002493D10F|nr:uncharacterized protein LOC129988074 isoform X2 [Argiope bruennichi]
MLSAVLCLQLERSQIWSFYNIFDGLLEDCQSIFFFFCSINPVCVAIFERKLHTYKSSGTMRKTLIDGFGNDISLNIHQINQGNKEYLPKAKESFVHTVTDFSKRFFLVEDIFPLLNNEPKSDHQLCGKGSFNIYLKDFKSKFRKNFYVAVMGLKKKLLYEETTKLLSSDILSEFGRTTSKIGMILLKLIFPAELINLKEYQILLKILPSYVGEQQNYCNELSLHKQGGLLQCHQKHLSYNQSDAEKETIFSTYLEEYNNEMIPFEDSLFNIQIDLRNEEDVSEKLTHFCCDQENKCVEILSENILFHTDEKEFRKEQGYFKKSVRFIDDQEIINNKISLFQEVSWDSNQVHLDNKQEFNEKSTCFDADQKNVSYEISSFKDGVLVHDELDTENAYSEKSACEISEQMNFYKEFALSENTFSNLNQNNESQVPTFSQILQKDNYFENLNSFCEECNSYSRQIDAEIELPEFQPSDSPTRHEGTQI